MIASRRAELLFEVASIGYMVACIILGGASAAGIVSNLLLQLAALGLGWIAIARLVRVPLPRAVRNALAIAGLTFLLPLLQLIPLPSALWSALPGRSEMAATLAAMQVSPPWLGISMAPWLTINSWLALLPPMALFLAGMSLPESGQIKIVGAITICALLSIVIGTLQVAGGAENSLYFYQITNVGSAVGFFANRNHQACLLLITIPLLSLLFRSAGVVEMRAPAKNARRLAIIVMGLVIIFGIYFSGSRAGLILLLPTLLLSAAATLRTARGVAPMPWLIGATLMAVVALVGLSWTPAYDRMVARSSAFSQDVRFWAAPYSWQAAIDAAPVGTGFGTFSPVFRRYAGSANLGPTYVNHAHNDFLELFLTGGVPALLLLMAFLWWFAAQVRATWRLKPGHSSAIARSAQIIIVVILMHSLVDYPLRTAAMSAIFALAVALQIKPLNNAGGGSTSFGHAVPTLSRQPLARSRGHRPPTIGKP